MLTCHVLLTASKSCRSGFRASRDDILEHRFVEAQVSDQSLPLGVLLLELAQPPHLRRHQPDIRLAPGAERRFDDPGLQHTSPTLLPSSACFSTKAICAFENLDLFIARSASLALYRNWNFPTQSGSGNGQQVIVYGNVISHESWAYTYQRAPRLSSAAFL